MDEHYQTYLFDYYHNGAWWVLPIPATSEADAHERLNKLPHAQYKGILEMTIPARLGLLARGICWWRNFFTRAQ